MSGEIQHAHTLTVSGLRRAYSPGNKSIDQTTKRNVSGKPSISSSAHQALAMGAVVTAGWAYFENADLANFVNLGTDSSGTFIPFLKLLAGESVSVRLATSAPYAKADTAAVDLVYDIFAA